MSISVKVSYNSSKRRFALDENTSYADLRAKLADLFDLSATYAITYEDEERDLVTIASDAELAELFVIARRHNLAPLRMHLYLADAPVPDAPPPAATAAADPPSDPFQAARDLMRDGEPIPQLGNILSSFAQVLAAMGGTDSQQPSAPPCSPRQRPRGQPHGPRGAGRGPGCGIRRGPPRGAHRRWNRHGGPWQGPGQSGSRGDGEPFGRFLGSIFSSLPQMFNASGWNRGQGSSFMSQFDRASEHTKAAFHEFKDALSSEDKEVLMQLMFELVPAMREWIRNNIGESGPIAEDAISDIIASVNNIAQRTLNDSTTQRLTTLLRAVLTDSAIVDMIRQSPFIADFDFQSDSRDESSRFNSGGIAGFNSHRRVECDGCGVSPIVGSRFKCTNRENYDLCPACFANDTVSKEGMEFKECKYIWDAEFGDAAAPPAPLSVTDRGPRVAFLQKLLTDLGYMNETMYARRVGMFGPNTRMAVLQFQREYGLDSVTDPGVYDATTAASLLSVLELQTPPSVAAGGASASGAQASSSTSPFAQKAG